jgi:hypothetical protein
MGIIGAAARMWVWPDRNTCLGSGSPMLSVFGSRSDDRRSTAATRLAARGLGRVCVCIAFAALAWMPVHAFAMPPLTPWYWQNPRPDADAVSDFAVAQDGHAWALGSAIMESDDFGVNWYRSRSGGTASSVALVGTSTVVLATATPPSIRTSHDGGKSWADRPIPLEFEVRDVEFRDADEGWVVGTGGTIAHTTDAGDTWQQQVSGVTADIRQVRIEGSSRSRARASCTAPTPARRGPLRVLYPRPGMSPSTW